MLSNNKVCSADSRRNWCKKGHFLILMMLTLKYLNISKYIARATPYNRKRRHSGINYGIPDKFEEKFEFNKLNLSWEKTKRLPNERVSKSSFVSKNLIKSFTINRVAKLAHLNLAIMNIDKLWNKTVFSWKEILSEISIIFVDRIAYEDFDL